MVAVVSRTWTPFITRRTTESLTCWTSVTWRAGEDERPATLGFIWALLCTFDFKSSQGLGSDSGINGVQHLVYETVLQRPAYSKYAPCHVTETIATLQPFHFVWEMPAPFRATFQCPISIDVMAEPRNVCVYFMQLPVFFLLTVDILSLCNKSTRRVTLLIRELTFKGLPSLLGVRGHRAGSAHSQQIIQSGGDHSGERRLKIVSHLHAFAQTDDKFLSVALLTSGTFSKRSGLASQRLSPEDVSGSLREPCFCHPLAQPGPQLTGQPR